MAAHESFVVNAPFVTRFAPSPNGDLHLGHALSAITGFDLAMRHGGRFILRIEDIDMQRTREAHVANILEDLRWLGLTWDEPVLRQSTRFDAYRAAAANLRERGLLYPCFATRTEIENAVAFSPTGVDPDGAPLYPGLCKGIAEEEIERRMAAGEPACLRLDMDRALAAASARLRGAPLTFQEWNGDVTVPPQVVPADPARWGDAIIVRKDTPSSYHLAVVVDDAAQGITHVVRGKRSLRGHPSSASAPGPPRPPSTRNLPPPPPDARPRRPQTLQIPSRYELARPACRRRLTGRYSQACGSLITLGQSSFAMVRQQLTR